jgi:hypothetical protein
MLESIEVLTASGATNIAVAPDHYEPGNENRSDSCEREKRSIGQPDMICLRRDEECRHDPEPYDPDGSFSSS